MGMTYETDKQAKKVDEDPEPFTESIESCRSGPGFPPGAGDYTNWDSRGRPFLCRPVRASQGIGLLRSSYPERPSQQLWAWLCVNTAAVKAERQDRGRSKCPESASASRLGARLPPTLAWQPSHGRPNAKFHGVFRPKTAKLSALACLLVT